MIVQTAGGGGGGGGGYIPLLRCKCGIVHVYRSV